MAVINITSETWQKEVLTSKIPVVAGFWADWCHFCKRLDPVLDQLAEDFAGKVLFVKVNVDENPDIARKYGIQNLPTTKFLKSGRPCGEVTGAVPREQLKAEIEKIIGIKDPVEISSTLERKALVKTMTTVPSEPWGACIDAYVVASNLYFTSSHLLVDVTDKMWENSVASGLNRNFMELTRDSYKAIGVTYENALKAQGLNADGLGDKISDELERATCDIIKLYWTAMSNYIQNMQSLVKPYLRD